MDNSHEVGYVNTVEDYLYSLGAFSTIYGASNTLQHLGDASVRSGILAAGGHQLIPGGKSNFVFGLFGGNNLFEKGFNKTLGKTALGKSLASPGGVNAGFLNFSYYSNKAYVAAGGMVNKQALLPGINVTLKSSMQKHLNSVTDFTYDNSASIKKADSAVERATKNLYMAKEGTVVTINDSYSEKKIDSEFLGKAEAKLANAQKELSKQLGNQFSREEIIEAGAKLKGDELMRFSSGKAKEIAATYTDEMLLKSLGEAGSVLDKNTRQTAIEELEKKLAGQIAQQSKNVAFSNTLGGKTLALLGKGSAKTAGIFFSAPVQTALGIETAINIYSTLRTNKQLKQIKDWQAGKQGYYENPYTSAVIQKAGQITQRNDTELNTLLMSSNIAKNIASRVGVN